MWAGIAAEPGPAVVESFWFAPRDSECLRADLRTAGRAAPLGLAPVLEVNTEKAVDVPQLRRRLDLLFLTP